MIEFFLAHSPLFAYGGIIGVLVLTGAGLPIPEEVPIVAAGVLSSPAYDMLNPYIAFGCCLMGALLGDMVIYGIGRFLGTRYLHEHPRFGHLLHEERETKMEGLIQRHGLKVFLLARFLVGIRAPIYLAAGVMRIPFKRFLLVDAFCATLVVGTVFWLSFWFGEPISAFVSTYQRALTVAVVVIVAVAVLIYWLRNRRGSTQNGENEENDASAEPDATLKQQDTARRTRIVA